MEQIQSIKLKSNSSFLIKHTQLMKSLCQELKYIECDNNCGCMFSKSLAIKKVVLFNEYYYCSEMCKYDDDYDIQKSLNRYIDTLEDYIPTSNK
jgi:hypothetical protein